jgi:hypothetical protein
MLFVAGCEHVVNRTGGATISITPVCEDTEKPPGAFVLEVAVWRDHWASVGGGRSDAESWQEADPYVDGLRATVEGGRAARYVPTYTYYESRHLPWQDSVREAQVRGGWLEVFIYVEGYELGGAGGPGPLNEEVRSHLAAPALRRIDGSNPQFEKFWGIVSDAILFPRRMSAWEKASRDPEQRAAIERIYRWYIARYEVAVRDKPELLKEPDVARHVQILRERLTKLTGRPVHEPGAATP